MVEAITGLTSLVELNLESNRIDNAGCEVIATLISDSISIFHTINLGQNGIGDEGASIIANGGGL